jgi:pyruvate formate lyase activating enzyme
MTTETKPKGFIFDIKRNSSEDGPGIRTTIFFKGCPLSCIWCQNPEGLDPGPSLSFRKELCKPTECGVPCLSVCPSGALYMENNVLRINHAACTFCGRCAEVCPEHALELVGEWLSVDELYYRIAIDKPFFDATGGGVTASGGECTMQMDFLHAFFKKLKETHIHTAIETNGLFNFDRFCRLLLPWLDLIYFDVKLIDDEASRRYTGHSNRPILDNLVHLTKITRIPVVVRIPLIPDITATDKNLRDIARFLREHGIRTASVIPYNPLWQDKLERFGIIGKYPNASFMTQAEIQHCIDCLRAP